MILRNFLAFWSGRKRLRTPPAVLQAMQDEREALRRGWTQGVHQARQRLRQARHEGLKQEHGTRQHSKTPKPRRRRNKLTLDDVREIIILSRTLTQYELARKFNVHQSSISHIITRATWRNA